MPPSKKKRGKAARGPRPVDDGQLLVAAEKGDAPAVVRLLAAGADPNVSVTGRLPSGEVIQTTALCVAARHGLEVVRLLLDAGADPSRTSGHGTPLMSAAANAAPR